MHFTNEEHARNYQKLLDIKEIGKIRKNPEYKTDLYITA